MATRQVYNIRVSSYPEYQAVFEATDKRASNTLNRRVTLRIVVLAGLLALKHATVEDIERYIDQLVLDKYASVPDNKTARYRVVELTLHDTALAKSLLGHIAFNLRMHHVTYRQIYHIGIFRLAECSSEELKALIMSAEAIHKDLNS